MEVLLQSEAETGRAISFWNNPVVWLQEKNLARNFWVFFTVALFFDAGFSVYFFLFNLYLLDFHFNERAIGLVGGAFTLGSLAGTLPAGGLARKLGLRPLLFLCFTAAPLLGALRTLWMWEPAQIGLAFLAGVAMCIWGVCFLPAVARLTTERNRASAFSLIFSVSIGTAALGGVVCGYLPQWLRMAGIAMQAAETKRLILLASCAIAAVGLVPLRSLVLTSAAPEDAQIGMVSGSWLRRWKPDRFLMRFLPLMALWSVVLAAFTPFSNVFLSRQLHIPMSRIGLIFSIAQVTQFCMGLLTPVVIRAFGLMNGLAAMQIAAAVALGCMAGAHDAQLVTVLYLTFFAAQWMSSPGLYNLLMNETPDKDRSTAAAMTLFCNALAGSAATAGAGILFTQFGYPRVLLGIALLALAAAILFRLVIAPRRGAPRCCRRRTSAFQR